MFGRVDRGKIILRAGEGIGVVAIFKNSTGDVRGRKVGGFIQRIRGRYHSDLVIPSGHE